MSPIERSAGGGGGGGFTNPMTTKGDIIIENAVPAPARLGIGTTGQALEVSSGGLPAWQNPPGFQLDYVEITASVTITAVTAATAQSIIDGNAVTYDGSTRVKIEFWAAATGNSGVTGMNFIADLWDGGTDAGVIAQQDLSSAVFTGANVATFNMNTYGARLFTPTAGAHTYHIKGWEPTGANAIVRAGNGGASTYFPAWYRVTIA
jgi:hypothetical protein